ncbi:hypothetical protein SBA4_5360008 [Candidatus Sulfopaludibacter sp. SbA4]|nr:hypothetical protein SBA4_5360008 [Candidatus Sulfopaludibacter sp. SbA4]
MARRIANGGDRRAGLGGGVRAGEVDREVLRFDAEARGRGEKRGGRRREASAEEAEGAEAASGLAKWIGRS